VSVLNKLTYDHHHREVSYKPGQWVWLHLLHRPIASLTTTGKGKLTPKFFGPFKVTEHVDEVAYRLQLPVGAKLHDVFHVGLLKHCGEAHSESGVLPPIRHVRTCLESSVVTKSRLARGRHDLLVQWKGLTAADATWVELDEFRQTYPSFQLEDELIVQGERCHVKPSLRATPSQVQAATDVVHGRIELRIGCQSVTVCLGE
jgi:hypothetical protein